MIQNAYERLKADNATQQWWQEILNDPRFGHVMDAAKSLLEQTPPVIPPGAKPIEVFALSHAARIGTTAALDSLDKLGSREMAEVRAADAKMNAQKALTQTSAAGRGPGRTSAPPPEMGDAPTGGGGNG